MSASFGFCIDEDADVDEQVRCQLAFLVTCQIVFCISFINKHATLVTLPGSYSCNGSCWSVPKPIWFESCGSCFAKTATLTSWYGGAITVGGGIVVDASVGTALYQGSVWRMSTWAGFLAMRLRKGCLLFFGVCFNDWAQRWPLTQLGRTICLVEFICVVESNRV